MKEDSYEFTKQYEYSVFVPEVDEDTFEETGEYENISGILTFDGEATWSELDRCYYWNFSWTDSNNAFSQDGNAPAKEDEFINDFRNYLLQQGIQNKYLW